METVRTPLAGRAEDGRVPRVFERFGGEASHRKEEEMTGPGIRMTEGGGPPDEAGVAAWIGTGAYRYWQRIEGLIAGNYPGVFVPEWLFGGKKHGWTLRYKKGKSFCTFVPEKGRFMLLIVFGAAERAGAEAIRGDLSAPAREAYDRAATYHDGKWVLFDIDSERAVADAMRLLALKRKPKK